MMDFNLGWESDDSRAVSPVVGVILVVAITVALSAVIGVFVMDLGQNTSSSSASSAGVSVSGDTVQLVDNGDIQRLELRDENGTTIENTTEIGGTVSAPTAGDYTVVGVTDDGSETVIRSVSVSDDEVSTSMSASGTINVTGS